MAPVQSLNPMPNEKLQKPVSLGKCPSVKSTTWSSPVSEKPLLLERWGTGMVYLKDGWVN